MAETTKETFLSAVGRQMAEEQKKAAEPKALTAQKKDDSALWSEVWNDALCAGVAELLFVIMPFVVLTIVLLHTGNVRGLLYMPEWSLVSAVLMGQIVIKFTGVVLHLGSVKRERVILTMSGLIVCCFIPTLLVLAMVLLSTHVSLALAVTQAAIFVAAVVLYLVATILDSGARAKERLGLA